MIGKLLIDGDACPNRKEVVSLGNKYYWGVEVYCDYHHEIDDDCHVYYVDPGSDAVDMAIIRSCIKGDIVITQDYGLAALALGKGAQVIHTSGKILNDDNIDLLLMQRHMSSIARKKGERTHHNKRTNEDRKIFLSTIEKCLKEREEDEI